MNINPLEVVFVNGIHFKDQDLISDWLLDYGLDGIFHVEDDRHNTLQLTFDRNQHKEVRDLIHNVKKLKTLRGK